MYIWVGINVEDQLREVRRAVDGVFEKIEISPYGMQVLPPQEPGSRL